MLLLITLRYAHEIRSTEDFHFPALGLKKVGLNEREIGMATRLVEDMTDEWDPRQYHDTYREDLLARVEAKAKAGKSAVVTQPEEGKEPRRSAEIIDLMSLLKSSLKGKEVLRKIACFAEDPTHRILVDIDTELMRDLLGNLPTAKFRRFLNDRGNDLLRWPFGSRSAAFFQRIQPPITYTAPRFDRSRSHSCSHAALLSQMDVPTRSAFVISVIAKHERAAAVSVTSVPRSLALAVGPLLAGYLLSVSNFG